MKASVVCTISMVAVAAVKMPGVLVHTGIREMHSKARLLADRYKAFSRDPFSLRAVFREKTRPKTALIKVVYAVT